MDRINPELLRKYAEGRASDAECNEVEQWLDADDNLFEENSALESTAEFRSENQMSTLWKSFLLSTNEGLRQLKLWWWGTRIAVSVLVLFVGIWSVTNLDAVKDILGQQQLITLETPLGKPQRIQLSDSSVVFLAGGSRLVYPKKFRGEERQLSLVHGHAFFQVAKNPAKPFLLTSGSIQIKVLGTAFDLNNSEGEKDITVLLKEGAVEFSDQKGTTKVMRPGDKIAYSKADGKIKLYQNMEVMYEGEWTKGNLMFAQAHLQDVFVLLKEKFGVNFSWKGKALSETKVTGNFNNMPLDRILFLLEQSTDLRFVATKNNIQVSK